MDRPERIFSEFVDAWNAGERPDVEAHLARAPETDRAELAELIRSFIEHAPSPAYSADTVRELMQEPAVRAAMRSLDGQAGAWPSLLPRLRHRARVKRDELVKRLAAELGAAESADKVSLYYHRMEHGLIPAEGVSDRVLEALGQIIGESARHLRDAGRRLAPDMGGAQSAEVFARTATPNEELAGQLEGIDVAPSAREEWDEVDELFMGGQK